MRQGRGWLSRAVKMRWRQSLQFIAVDSPLHSNLCLLSAHAGGQLWRHRSLAIACCRVGAQALHGDLAQKMREQVSEIMCGFLWVSDTRRCHCCMPCCFESQDMLKRGTCYVDRPSAGCDIPISL
jgi:hypothetical protein